MTDTLNFSPTFTDFDSHIWDFDTSEIDSGFVDWQLKFQQEEKVVETEERPLKLLLEPCEVLEQEAAKLDAQIDSDQWMKDFLEIDENAIQNLPEVNADLVGSLDLSNNSRVDSLPELDCSVDLNFSTQLDSFSLNQPFGFGNLPAFNNVSNFQSMPFNIQPWGVQPVYVLACRPSQHPSFGAGGRRPRAPTLEAKVSDPTFESAQPKSNAANVSKLTMPCIDLTAPTPELSKIPNPTNPVVSSPSSSGRSRRSHKNSRPGRRRRNFTQPTSEPEIVKVLEKRKGKFLVEYSCNSETGDRREPQWLPAGSHHTIPRHLVQEYYQNAWKEIRNKVEQGQKLEE